METQQLLSKTQLTTLRIVTLATALALMVGISQCNKSLEKQEQGTEEIKQN